jgi:hypothetical protein
VSSWEVVPCLLTLRNEFNLVRPKRDKGADGTIGDANHSPGSDHSPDEDSRVLRDRDPDHKNEVHALDIDSTGPWPDGKGGEAEGWFDKQIHRIIAEERRRWLDPNDMCRLNYVIWRGMIYDKDNDWVGKIYTGSSDKHFDHVHFSARYETRAESDTRSWGVYVPPKPALNEEIPVDAATFNKLMDGWAASANGKKLISAAVLATNVGSKEVPQRTLGEAIKDLENQLRPAFVFPPDHKENKTSGMPANAPVLELLAVPARLTKIEQALSKLTNK